MEQKYSRIVLFLSVPLAVIVIFISSIGLFTPDFYAAETLNWQAQSMGQDLIDLFLVVPILILSSILALRRNKYGLLIWGGVNLYLVYTFCIYCFDVHFNSLFVLYCVSLGLSFYSLVYFITTQIQSPLIPSLKNKALRKIIGFYFIFISIIFYILWLSEIMPYSFSHNLPQSLIDVGLPTNPIHVIDLAIVLPGLFLTGVLLWKNSSISFFMTPVCLVFFIMMDITIGTLIVFMHCRGLETSLTISFVMGALALLSLIFLILYFIAINKKEA